MLALTYRIAAGLAAILLGLCSQAAAHAQNIQTRERQVLDPETNEWVAAPPATQPAEVEPLTHIRQALARGEWRDARKHIQEWLAANPDSELYAEAEYLRGETYFQAGDYYAAYQHYELVIENAAGELFYDTLKREMDVARAFLSGEPRILWRIFRVPAYEDGLEILGRIWERVPGTRLAEDALKLRADFEMERGNVGIAQDEYANLAREYPAGRFTAYALLRSAVAAEAAFPGIRFDDRALLQALERYRQLQSSFPGEAERQSVAIRLDGIREQRAAKDFDIARWYERTNQSGAAVFYYRAIVTDWPGTLAERQARARLKALGIGGSPEPEPEPDDVPPASEPSESEPAGSQPSEEDGA